MTLYDVITLFPFVLAGVFLVPLAITLYRG